ncbi:MAG TPA: YbfB/YjiJ family MFS transporter [Burkholderiales bacterium]|nr:YbfB/YjiJ family MFS transporter [Burkholderiales bacterium]
MTSRTRASPNINSGWIIAVAGLLGLALAQGIGRFAFTPILPMMQGDAGVSLAEGGWLAAANYLGYLVGALWAMVQRARADHAIRASLAITAGATVAMAFTDGLAAWLALRALAGVSSAWALIHMSSWCAQRLARLGRPGFNGIVFAGVGAGVVLAGALCLALMTAGAGSRTAWLWLGAIGVLITAMVWPVLHDSESAAASAAFAGYRWTPDAVRLVACYSAFGIGYIIPATFVPVMAKQVIEDPAVFGWAWPLFGAAAMTSTLLAGALQQVLSARWLWMASACVMALGVAAPLVIDGLAGILACALLVGGTFVVATLAGVQVAREVAGGAAHVLLAAMTAAFAASQVAGPLLVSFLVERSGGFGSALVLAFGVLVTSAAALMLPLRSASR